MASKRNKQALCLKQNVRKWWLLLSCAIQGNALDVQGVWERDL